MTTLKSLKNLVSVIVGGDIAPADIPGTTIPEVIDYLAENYPGGGGTITVGSLTVTTKAGATVSTSKVTVSPAITSGNSYVYKMAANEISEPEYHEIISGATAWDGTSDIEGEDGYHIAIYEITSEGKAVKFGQAIMKVNLG